MRKLVTVEAVRERAIMPDAEVINRGIARAIEAATVELQSALRIPDFAFASQRVDRFYVAETSLFGGRFFTKFLLDRGLVTEALNDVQVKEANRAVSLIQDDANVTDLRDIVGSSAIVEHKDQYVRITDDGLRRGVILVEDFRFLRRHVEITYDAGITPDRNKPDDRFQQEVLSIPASVSLTFSTGPDQVVRDAGSWTDDGYRAGDVVVFSGTASNNVQATVDSISQTTNPGDTMAVTVAGGGSFTAEGPVSGVTVDDLTVIPVPNWLKELATLHALWEVLSDGELASQSQNQAGPRGRAGMRPQTILSQLELMLDRYSRYEPAAIETTTGI